MSAAVDDDLLSAFALEVGGVEAGPVTVVGGRTAWEVGGAVSPEAREVTAPVGVVEFEPAEMTVRVRAGTTVTDLDAVLADAGQCIALPDRPGATVGGVLAVGHSGIRALGWGPVRDVLLEARVVTAEGKLVKAGGPTVKNVSGYDLCRLLVGSLGTLACLAEVVLRTRPAPRASRWLSGRSDPFALRRSLLRANAILWDGTITWVLLEGHDADVDAEARICEAGGLRDCPEGAPASLGELAYRRSMRPDELPGLAAAGALSVTPSPFLAQIGVGLVHVSAPAPPQSVSAVVADLNHRVRIAFDPTGRLNPGRDPQAR